MVDLQTLIFCGAAGGLLGVIFFGGLWWTVQRGMVSSRPVTWFVGSVLVRMGLVLLGFYLVGANDFSRFLACLIGFMLARIALMRFTKIPANKKKEGHDAT
ncbi:ATP synthase subunit I [Akkermansiaceae bacterium]|nr:ATP synthase subunit I [Akkermansiaceae bacterium]MDB4466132.1 ATP synthase subunit I [bacterium]MDA7891275.1 ATP synthase subunit I [Akkermansiaceae bacterium]MDA7929388.1 ATP synthase subunit I [Akkermansiaceae bacterium]MDA9830658.1 ATP synthase subunit I [Akkermansiaceae bacterium]